MPGGTDNAWGDFVLLEPDDAVPEANPLGSPPAFPLQDADLTPTRLARFGGWVGTGVYNENFPVQQFFVSARQRSLEDPSAGFLPEAGQVYTFHLPNTP